jgi:hypothetical protein
MGFAQHQSFYFREKWLEKIFSFYESIQSIEKKSLFNVDNFYKLGVGKNMFEAMKYWIKAFNLFDKNYELTPLGNVIKSKDPMLLDINTLSLLHFELVSNKTEASFWYWFFNEFSGNILYKENIYSDSSLAGWAKFNFKKVSNNSLKKDLLCLIQMYLANENKNDPEDVLFSPFNRLNLIHESEHALIKNSMRFENIGLVSLFYSLLSFFENKNIRTVSVDDLANLSGLWGKIFSLDKTNIIKALNELNHKFPKLVSFQQSSRLDIVTVSNIDKYLFLKEHLGITNE